LHFHDQEDLIAKHCNPPCVMRAKQQRLDSVTRLMLYDAVLL
jgi:hypothetical protein